MPGYPVPTITAANRLSVIGTLASAAAHGDDYRTDPYRERSKSEHPRPGLWIVRHWREWGLQTDELSARRRPG